MGFNQSWVRNCGPYPDSSGMAPIPTRLSHIGDARAVSKTNSRNVGGIAQPVLNKIPKPKGYCQVEIVVKSRAGEQGTGK